LGQNIGDQGTARSVPPMTPVRILNAAMSKKAQIFLQTKQAMFAYSSSLICLVGFFLWTMLVHYNGKIDWEYLGYATSHIVLISAVPAILIYFIKRSKWYFSIMTGAVVGFLVAILVVKIKIGF
jgi:hypothetical protein